MTTKIIRAMNGQWTNGMWRYGLYQGETVIVIRCPKCGHAATLGDHVVHDDGDVEPGVFCNKCKFADHIELEKYEAVAQYKSSAVH